MGTVVGGVFLEEIGLIVALADQQVSWSRLFGAQV